MNKLPFLNKIEVEPGKRPVKAGLKAFDLEEDKLRLSHFLINPFSRKEFQVAQASF